MWLPVSESQPVARASRGLENASTGHPGVDSDGTSSAGRQQQQFSFQEGESLIVNQRPGAGLRMMSRRNVSEAEQPHGQQQLQQQLLASTSTGKEQPYQQHEQQEYMQRFQPPRAYNASLAGDNTSTSFIGSSDVTSSSVGMGSLANVCTAEYDVVRSSVRRKSPPTPSSSSLSPPSDAGEILSAGKRPRPGSASSSFIHYPTVAPSSDQVVGAPPQQTTSRDGTWGGNIRTSVGGLIAGNTALLPSVFSGGADQWDERLNGTARAVEGGGQSHVRLPPMASLLGNIRKQEYTPRGSPLKISAGSSNEDTNLSFAAWDGEGGMRSSSATHMSVAAAQQLHQEHQQQHHTTTTTTTTSKGAGQQYSSPLQSTLPQQQQGYPAVRAHPAAYMYPSGTLAGARPPSIEVTEESGGVGGRQTLHLPPEVSRKRPRSAPPVGGVMGVTMSSSCASSGLASWQFGVGGGESYLPSSRQQGGCCAEGCRETAMVSVEGVMTSGSLQTGR